MRSEQLPLLVSVGTPSVHPDGTWAAVATSRPDFGADAYVGQLWRVPLEAGATPRRITRGFHDSSPRFSPDGTLLAFLRGSVDGPTQLAIVDARGGEPMLITSSKRSVDDFAWSPDGSTIVFTARVSADGRYGTLAGVDAGAEDPRRITGLSFHSNGLGFTGDQRRQLFRVSVPDITAEPVVAPIGRAARDGDAAALVPEAVQLTHGDADVSSPFFGSANDGVFVTGALHESADSDLVSDLYRVGLSHGELERVTAGDLDVQAGCWGGDGALYVVAASVGESRRDFVGRNTGVFRRLESGDLERLTDAESVLVTDLVPADEGVIAVEERRGRSQIHLISGGIDEVLDPDGVVAGVASAPDGSVVASVVTQTSAGDLVWLRDGERLALTDFSAALRDASPIALPRELTATAPDGYPVHGWVLTPAGDGPHPTLLVIHGGPFSAYHDAFFDEWQTYVEAGYAVVSCNPRGSAGYGESHGRAIKGDMGNLDYRDIMAFLDAALDANPSLDRQRLGVMGGSYGGYMTAWIIAHDHRFRGAIVERGFLDAATFTGASDIGWFFQQEYNGTTRAEMDRQSPMTYVDQVTTPTLVIHSEQDIRCPIAQGYRYYTELKLRGVETELLVFPGENHELSRSGRPWHRRQRLDAILEWWQRWLPAGRAS